MSTPSTWRKISLTFFAPLALMSSLVITVMETGDSNLALGKRGLHVPWPCKETLNNQQLEYFNNNQNKNMTKILCVGKDGWPIEGFIGKPIKTFIRRLFLTCKFEMVDNVEKRLGIKMKFN